MPSEIERYERLKSSVDKLRREADRAQGSLDQLMTRLREQFGCKTVEQADQEREERKENKRIEKQLNAKLMRKLKSLYQTAKQLETHR